MVSSAPEEFACTSGTHSGFTCCWKFSSRWPKIGRLVGLAFGIDHDRQVTGEAHRVHVVEEEGPVSAEQVLHIVLGGREQDVDPGLIHETVETRGIERQRHGLASLALSADYTR